MISQSLYAKLSSLSAIFLLQKKKNPEICQQKSFIFSAKLSSCVETALLAMKTAWMLQWYTLFCYKNYLCPLVFFSGHFSVIGMPSLCWCLWLLFWHKYQLKNSFHNNVSYLALILRQKSRWTLFVFKYIFRNISTDFAIFLKEDQNRRLWSQYRNRMYVLNYWATLWSSNCLHSWGHYRR